MRFFHPFALLAAIYILPLPFLAWTMVAREHWDAGYFIAWGALVGAFALYYERSQDKATNSNTSQEK